MADRGDVIRGMLEQIMNSSNFDYLSRGLEAANLRHEVISNNIANVNTPHFKRSAVNFEDLLAKELHLDYKAAFNEKRESALPGQAENSEADGESRAALETPLNLTNHSYFNLNGHDSGTVLTQEVWIDAEYFTEADRRSIPTGTLLEVKWTPMDFRKPKALGKEIDADYEQLRFGGGYDHNFVLGSGQGEYREVASMYAADSGINMSVATDLPGIQLYTANGLNNEMGKDDAVYGKRDAACFETQFWPDTINKENFPGGILREGEEFTSRTTYAFSVAEAE